MIQLPKQWKMARNEFGCHKYSSQRAKAAKEKTNKYKAELVAAGRVILTSYWQNQHLKFCGLRKPRRSLCLRRVRPQGLKRSSKTFSTNPQGVFEGFDEGCFEEPSRLRREGTLQSPLKALSNPLKCFQVFLKGFEGVAFYFCPSEMQHEVERL